MTKVLTQRAVDSAKPKPKRYPVADGLVPNQYLLVHPSGEKSYAISPRLHGRTIKITIGDASVLMLAQARTEGRRILSQIALGKDPREAKQAAIKTASETVEVVARKFIERHAKVHTRRWQETERLLESEILPRLGKRSISSIARRDVIALLDAIVDRGAGVTANRTLTVAKKMFGWAVERDLIETSPLDRVRRPAPETPRDRVLTDSELALIWRAADEVDYPIGPFVGILILTSQRRNEVSGMCWSELNSDLTLWTLPRERAKNNTEHLIPLAPRARSILRDLPRINDSDYVFTTTGRTSINNHARAKLAIDAAVAGLNGGKPISSWTFHDIRRSAATGMARLGVQLPVVEKILNHTGSSFGGVAGIYQRHDFADEKRAALECWARHLSTLDLVERVPETSRNPVSRAWA